MPGKAKRHATSVAQRHMMGMIAHATPDEIEKAGPTVKEAASSLTKEQAREMASVKEKGLPEHAHPKKHRGDHRSSGRQKKGRGDYEK